MDYQINKHIGTIFKCKSTQLNDIAFIKGLACTYKVIEGTPQIGDMLEIVDVLGNCALVKVNKRATERKMNYID